MKTTRDCKPARLLLGPKHEPDADGRAEPRAQACNPSINDDPNSGQIMSCKTYTRRPNERRKGLARGDPPSTIRFEPRRAERRAMRKASTKRGPDLTAETVFVETKHTTTLKEAVRFLQVGGAVCVLPTTSRHNRPDAAHRLLTVHL